ncbi:MAG: sugar ABC transporter substrate-binding protein [Chloroflexi bacterium]|nr:MAG: sugar ABC transporter substrate-binding protein [Chloroflexota bacterium]
MKKLILLLVLLAIGVSVSFAQGPTEITIITVNNPDMVVMQSFTDEFEALHPDISLNWVVLPENELRQRVTTDVATGTGTFDVVTVGTFEVPIWAENGWIFSMDDLFEEFPDAIQPNYNVDDLIPPIRSGLSFDGELHAVPFYGESSMTFYNTRLFEEAGLEMPLQPTWEQIREFACQLHDPENGQFGIVLRGLPGWGEVFAPLTTVINTFGGRWFDENWEPQLTAPETVEAVNFYVNLVNECGAPGATGIGFTEALTLMSQGQAAIWVDATVAAGFLTNPEQSEAFDEIGFAQAPVGPVDKGNNWLWAWSLAIPTTSPHVEEALTFVTWATSQDYIELVGETNGWGSVPPGTRISTYERPEYQEAAPFAPLVLEAIEDADPTDATRDPVPYVGVQFVGIPEFQSIGTDVSQVLAEAFVGNITVEEALAEGNEIAREQMADAGYYDN